MRAKTYIMIKPGFADSGEMLDALREKLLEYNFAVEVEGFVKYTVADARRHYAEHVGKNFYPNLEQYITSDRAYGVVVYKNVNAREFFSGKVITDGREVVKSLRAYAEALMPNFYNQTRNAVHGSDGPSSAEKEISLFKDMLKREAGANASPKIILDV